MIKYALVVMTDTIKIKRFAFKDEVETARQALLKQGAELIQLKWHNRAKKWVKQEEF